MAKAKGELTPEDWAKAKEARAKAPSRKQRLAAYADSFAKQRRVVPKHAERIALPLIAKAEAGSLTAAVAVHCLECSGWVRQEVRDCVIPQCHLFPYRPWQGMTAGNPNDPPEGGAGE